MQANAWNMKNDMWIVRRNHVNIAVIHIPGSDKDWSLVGKTRQMIADADPDARITLASEIF